MNYLESGEKKLLHIHYKCPTVGILIRKVKTIVVNRAVLRIQLHLFFPLKDFTQDDFEGEDNYILEVEGQTTGREKYQYSKILSVLVETTWIQLHIS
jgi:hypothetical protein